MSGTKDIGVLVGAEENDTSKELVQRNSLVVGTEEKALPNEMGLLSVSLLGLESEPLE